VVCYRQFSSSPTKALKPSVSNAIFVQNWRSQLATGVQLGSPRAPVQIIEFADFECPYCSTYHFSLNELRRRYPTKVGLSFVHFPLPMHRYAEPAARVAECASQQGRFEAMHDLLFEQQRLFGSKSWLEFAREADIPSVSDFEACVNDSKIMPRIIEGQRLAQHLDIPGTPTLIINGWQLPSPPTLDELDRMVKAVLEGKDPIQLGAGSRPP
jgi:protein-disulfide isomerase